MDTPYFLKLRGSLEVFGFYLKPKFEEKLKWDCTIEFSIKFRN
jgi:hypothetical protein